MKVAFIYVLCMLSFSIGGKATHIIGGVIDYDYAPNVNAMNNYAITMKIYRDCNSSTPFDGQFVPGGIPVNPARISIFELGTNIMVDTLELWNPIVTVVDPPINSLCLDITTNVCVEEGVYQFEYNFPDMNKGYYITYERCCRNGTINNLINPGQQGAAYTVDIPPTNLYQNSNPEFNLFPPVFICVNYPLIFNHSATDPDGDSLVYSLCEPLLGASQTDPAPIATAKPYFPVNWFAPYNSQDPLGGVPLNIDPASGVLTGTPNQLGQFVVGVCVEEYRNGVLLSKTLRDFQFNVTTCNFPVAGVPGIKNIDPVSGIGDYKVDCKDLSVLFKNASVGATEYFWNFGDLSVSSDTSHQFEPLYAYPDTGTYFVTLVASNDDHCSDTLITRVKLYPIVNADFDYETVCADSSVEFLDLSTTTFGTVNSWKWDFGDSTSSSNKKHPDHKYGSGGLYDVSLIMGSSKGCIDTIRKQVRVYNLPVAGFNNVNGCIYDSIGFIQNSTGNIIHSNWNFGDGNFSNLPEPVQTYQQSGIFSVALSVVTNKGCKDTIYKDVEVFELPDLQTSGDTIICTANSASVAVSGANAYNWNPSSFFNDPSVSNPKVSPASPGYIYVEGTDVNGCRNTDSLYIDIYAIPNIEAGQDTSVCFEPNSFRDSVTLKATGGVSYIWTPSKGLDDSTVYNPTARPPFNMKYYVTGTDTNGCVATDSLRIYYLDPKLDLIANVQASICIYDTISIPVIDQGLITSYSWSPVSGISNPGIRDPLFYPENTDTYILTISNYCYFKDDSVTILVNPLPVINTGKVDSICLGDTIQLHAEGGTIYKWKFDPTLSTLTIPDPLAFPPGDNTYYIKVIDSVGCENEDSIEILVYLPPMTSTAMMDDRDFICFGQSVYLNATGGKRYFWEADSTLMDQDTVNPLVTPYDTNTYYVNVTNKHGCTARDSFQVDIQGKLPQNPDTLIVICEGDYQKLNVKGGFYYEWLPAKYLNYSTIADPVVKPLEDIHYIVKVSNDCFQDTVQIEINVQELPIADAGPDKTIYRGESTTLEANGNGSYLWVPVEGLSDPSSGSTNASPFNTTTYYLRVMDEFGCASYDSIELTVIPIDVLLLPSGFSPNGDGTNDRFGILESMNVKRIFEFSVYNRWGEKVFSANKMDERWDGTFRGRKAEMGTYSYYIEYLNKNGDKILKSGNITLLR